MRLGKLDRIEKIPSLMKHKKKAALFLINCNSQKFVCRLYYLYLWSAI
jgi:hypothetical protein